MMNPKPNQANPPPVGSRRLARAWCWLERRYTSMGGWFAAAPRPGNWPQAVLDNPHFALIVTDVKGTILVFNRGAERLFGYRAELVQGYLSPEVLVDPQQLQARAGHAGPVGFAALVFKALRGVDDSFELTAINLTGRRFPVLWQVSVLRGRQGQVLGFSLVGHDRTAHAQLVHEHAMLEARWLEQHAKLRQSAQSMTGGEPGSAVAETGILSTMSHELRTPLNAILGFAQLMASEIPPPSVAQKRSLDQILQAGWYLLGLVNKILDLSAIEAGQVKVSAETVALADVLGECHSMVQLQAQQRGIELHLPVAPIVFQVAGDRIRLKQVLLNLLSNAIKYNRSGGWVQVYCQPVGPARLRIGVKDGGIGMSEAQLAQLFQPFNRLGQEAGGQEGTGIGLVVTRQLVQLMGGVMGVESRVGQGSEFWLELEWLNPDTAVVHDGVRGGARDAVRDGILDVVRYGAAALVPEAEAGRHYQLLLVEDHPASAALVRQLVARRSNISLVSATDGYVGLQLARTCLPDVILFDINLPGISGLHALKLLQEDPATAAIPVLAISVNALPRDIAEGLQAGFFRYLTKPLKVFEFMEALDVALHQAGQARPCRTVTTVVPDSE